MSARAITPDLLKRMWVVNHLPEHWSIQTYTSGKHNNSINQSKTWKAGGRTRRALWAAYTLAFWCLLRFDEVLRIRAEDIEIISDTCFKLTLWWRKTDQNGGSLCLRCAASADDVPGIKPFFLHLLPEDQAHLCPVLAMAHWVAASGITSGYLFRRLQSDRVSVDDVPMVRCFPQRCSKVPKTCLADVSILSRTIPQ
jgi:hypothetical protein